MFMTATVPPVQHAPDADHGRLDPLVARTLHVEGVVQGVGFRPFVWRLATGIGLAGRVRNAAGRVEVEAAGTPGQLDDFARRLRDDAPPRARVERVTASDLATPPAELPVPFRIDESVVADAADRLFPPDIATCDDCLRELFDPADRRYRYPFTNCTNCGPRATIIDELPYDRAQTTMRAFPLCPACAAEYADPANRRFHAEPVACAACGPRLAWRPTEAPATVAEMEDALAAAAGAIRRGEIVAVKGLGGYHLACDATDDAAVRRLRDRKRRWAKPFAVVVADVAAAERLCRVNAGERALLTGPERPIVLLDGRRQPQPPALAPSVAAGNRRLGVFLPYTPLHHLLLAAVDRPIVLTSGNLTDEPLATDDDDARVRLAGLADGFLSHDREIRARYDDSVTTLVADRATVVRRARGHAPEAITLPVGTPRPILAVGAELKHTFTLARGRRAHVAPHNGDLEDLATHRAFTDGLAHLSRLLALEPEVVVHDLHPEYLSTKYAVQHFEPARRIAVQHHHAHVASCAAEHGITEPFLGVAYDGLGMGDDGTLWGGEILLADLTGYRRMARFARAPLPGGALAVKRPYRMALGYLFGGEWLGHRHDPDNLDPRVATFLGRLDLREVAIVRTQIARNLNAPLASSAGRLFDAVASFLGLRDVAEYEAQAAIDLELAAGDVAADPLPYAIESLDDLLVYDTCPTLRSLVIAHSEGRSVPTLAAAFHETIAAVTEELLEAARNETGVRTVCLSGGVFQNRRLAGTLLQRLERNGFEPFINERVPVNDGGISFGQAAVAAARLTAAARHTSPGGR